MGVWDGKSEEDALQEGRFKGRVQKKNGNSKLTCQKHWKLFVRGDWMDHLFVTIYQELTSSLQCFSLSFCQ